MIYICIPVFNRVEYSLKCIESIKKQNYKDFQIIVCDDASTDGTRNIIEGKFPDVKIISGNGNLWWSGGTNKCVEEALKTAIEDDYLFTLNNDTELLADTLQTLIQFTKNHNNTIVGAVNVFYSEPMKIEPSAFIQKPGKIFFNKLHYRVNEFGENINNKKGMLEVSTLSGKGVLIPVEVFKKIGLYNQEKLPHYHADTEFILRAKKNGFKVYLSYDAIILSHQELSGFGTVTSKPSMQKFIKSLFSLKSANHLPSLYRYTKIIYGKSYLFYLLVYFVRINGGFLRRYVREIFFGK